MMERAVHEPSEQPIKAILRASDSTAFYVWFIITLSAGVIMAQDTWSSWQQPRTGTADATATFTKVLVIHALWLFVSIIFVFFTWRFRPTSAWRWHLVIGAVTCVWTIGVLVYAFTDVKRVRVTTWVCTSSPQTTMVTDDFLASCKLADSDSTIRMGSNIYFWSADDKHYWRWIVLGDDTETVQMSWPQGVDAIYLAAEGDNATLDPGADESIPGGTWSASFDPAQERSFRLFTIEHANPSATPEATP